MTQTSASLMIAQGEKTTRGFFQLTGTFLGFAIAAVASLLAALRSIVVVPVILTVLAWAQGA